jgi:uncharacterized repeat protein (TIGR01451 family)
MRPICAVSLPRALILVAAVLPPVWPAGPVAEAAPPAAEKVAREIVAAETVELPTAGRALALRYAASGPLDAEQAGATVLGCESTDGRCETKRWVDVDGDPSTFNSSRATVTMPAGATVDRAALYWGGDLAADRVARCAATAAEAAPAPDRADRVRIRLDAGDLGVLADFTSVRATTVDGLRTANGYTYQAYANVTRLFAAVREPAAALPVVVTLANVQVAQGPQCVGGWRIVVTYRHADGAGAAHRAVLLFDGLAAPGSPRTIRLDGFRAAAPLDARVGLVAYGSAKGDLTVGRTSAPARIAEFDAGTVGVPAGGIAPGATSAVVSLPPGQYAAGAVLFSARTEALVRIGRAVVPVASDGADPASGTEVNGDVAAGERLRLSVEVRNIAARTLRLANLAESVPAGLAMVTGSVRLDGRTLPDAAVGDAGAGYSIGLGDIPPGATRTVAYEATVADDARSGIPVVARARLDFWVDHAPDRPSESGPLFVRSDQVEVVPNRVDLELAMKVDETEVPADGEVRFGITVTNAGRSPATGVVVADRLPSGLAPLLAEPSQGTFDGVGRRWSVGALAPGAAATLSLLVRVDDPGSFINTAEVTALRQHDLDSVPDDADPRSDDAATATVTGAASRVRADLAVSQALAGPFTPGRRGRLALAVTNQGPGVASGIALSEALPRGLSFVSGGGDGWTCEAAAGGAICRDGRDGLQGRWHPGETTRLELLVAVAPDAPAELTAVATVTSGVDDPEPSDDAVATRIRVGSGAATPAPLAGPAAWVGLAVMAVGAGLLGTAAVLHRRVRRTRTIPR